MNHAAARPEAAEAAWPSAIFETLKRAGVRQVAYVPDAGHRELIARCHAETTMKAIALTTEEEGVALLAGAWLGGERGVLLMQSSGVGNCINMLGTIRECRLPFATIVTMRGEWGEFNPWQVPMGSTTRAALETAGVHVHRVEHGSEAATVVEAGLGLAFQSSRAVAILIAQRVIGAKVFDAVER